MNHHWTITPEQDDQRLDKVLVPLSGKTRSQIQKAIKAGLVFVNGKVPSVHQFLSTGDTIDWDTAVSVPKKAVLVVKQEKKRIPAPVILETTKDFFIIEKPAGLLVHATAKKERNTLAAWLFKKYPALKKIGDNETRGAIVHRLDKDVSGLMIIPRTKKSFAFFKKQFQERKMHKEYLALVYGSVPRDDVTITFPLARSKKGTFVARAKRDLDTRDAETQFHIEKRFINFTLLRVFPITGRTNQIRIHLMAYSHPIVGDHVYQLRAQKSIPCPQIFLHATKLSFTGLDGKDYSFESPLPKTLQTFLTTVK